ncbi:MAG: hypothetical protein JW952_02590, partial [Candidatus Eisenbacteria bacterium]|nr:hypothetical protein [Candidatus Eisenbacteria bacterium]
VGPGVAVRSEDARPEPELSAPSREEAGEQGSLTGEVPAGGITADAGADGLLAGDLPTDDGSTVRLADLSSELPELDELVAGVGGTRDSDFMLFYLTEEEETRLVEELESSTDIREFD